MKNKQKAWRTAAATDNRAWVTSGRHKKRRGYRARVWALMLRLAKDDIVTQEKPETKSLLSRFKSWVKGGLTSPF